MDWSPSLVLSIIALIVSVIGGALVRIFVGRTFKGIDDSISSLTGSLETLNIKVQNGCWISPNTCDMRMRGVEKLTDLIPDLDKQVALLISYKKRIEEVQDRVKNIDAIRVEFLEKFVPIPEFSRQIKIITSQLEGIYKKIDSLDNKLDSYRRG